MADPLLEFRGVDLLTALETPTRQHGKRIQIVSGFLAAPESRGTDSIVARRAGRSSGSRKADTLRILLEGFITGETPEEWLDERAELMAVLDENDRDPGLLLARPPYLGLDSAGGDAWVLARVKNYVEGPILAKLIQTYSIELESVVPYWNRDVPPDIPTEHTLVVATGTDWTGLDLVLNGGATNAEPGTWKLPGYDDSAWDQCVIATPGPGQFAIPGADLIVDAASDGSGWTGEGFWIARKSFVLPAVPTDDSTLHLTCDNELIGAWINGNLVGTLPDVDNWTSDHTFTVDPSVFDSGENVLGVKVKNTLPVPAGTNVQASIAITYLA